MDSVWLPSDLMEQILLRLPAKSLLRFKSICKSWKSLINDPRFINNHLQVALSRSSSGKTVFGWIYMKPSSGTKYSVVSLANGGHNESSLGWDITEQPRNEIESDSYISGDNKYGSHCNGLICLVNFLPCLRQQELIVYNPALREQRSLIVQTIPDDHSLGPHGFGHDPRTHEFKLVTITRLENSDGLGPFKANVYTLGTNFPREVELPDMSNMFLTSGAYLKGRYYWIELFEGKLLSFDMSEESFSWVALPSWDLISHGWCLAVLNESLVLAVHTRELIYPFSNLVDLWVTETVDGRDWTKQRTIRLELGMELPIAFVKDNEVLIEGQDGCVALYNISTGNQRRLCKTDQMRPWSTFIASSYVESLVSVESK